MKFFIALIIFLFVLIVKNCTRTKKEKLHNIKKLEFVKNNGECYAIITDREGKLYKKQIKAESDICIHLNTGSVDLIINT